MRSHSPSGAEMKIRDLGVSDLALPELKCPSPVACIFRPVRVTVPGSRGKGVLKAHAGMTCRGDRVGRGAHPELSLHLPGWDVISGMAMVPWDGTGVPGLHRSLCNSLGWQCVVGGSWGVTEES